MAMLHSKSRFNREKKHSPMTSFKYLIAFLMVVAAIQDVHAVQPLSFVVPAEN
jgi:hypothetical protein